MFPRDTFATEIVNDELGQSFYLRLQLVDKTFKETEEQAWAKKKRYGELIKFLTAKEMVG